MKKGKSKSKIRARAYKKKMKKAQEEKELEYKTDINPTGIHKFRSFQDSLRPECDHLIYGGMLLEADHYLMR